MKKITILASVFCALTINAQTKRPDNWFNLDPMANSVNGVSTEKTYEELLKGKKSTTIIVGVLDSGVDYKHESSLSFSRVSRITRRARCKRDLTVPGGMLEISATSSRERSSR